MKGHLVSENVNEEKAVIFFEGCEYNAANIGDLKLVCSGGGQARQDGHNVPLECAGFRA